MLSVLASNPHGLVMSSSRSLSIVGASEETTAHIRLLLRIAGIRLQHHWELRDGDDADLLLIEPHDDIATEAIRARCEAGGIPYAIICNEDDLVVHGMALRRPIKLVPLAAILNTAGAMRTDADVLSGSASNFYDLDLSADIPKAAAPGGWDRTDYSSDVSGTSAATTTTSDTADAFDLLVHGDPLAEPLPPTRLVDENTRLEKRTGSDTTRSAMQRDAGTRAAASLLGVAPVEVLPIDLEPLTPAPHAQRGSDPANTPLPLLPGLLREGALSSPTRVSAPGLPVVVLDPKVRRYYSGVPLQDLLPYAKVMEGVAQAGSIVGADLQRVRNTQTPRPFDELRWLFALGASHGRLDEKLDPGGSYAVPHPFVAAPELRSHGRIVALMATPMPLHEVARASGARMDEVFDIVNAYAAVERIEYVPRGSLRGKNPDEGKGGLWGLFTRK